MIWPNCKVASVLKPYANGDPKITIRVPGGSGFSTGQVLSVERKEPIPPPPPPEPIYDRAITVGEDLVAIVNAAAINTRFLLRAGTHRVSAPVSPKNGQSFTGEMGAIVSGGNSTPHAFTGSGSGVVLDRLIIEHFANPAQQGAIHGDHSQVWTVRNCEVRYTAGTGIRTGPRMQILTSKIHHNAQLGIGGLGDDMLIEGNEIAYNNYESKFDPGWEAGGTKFVLSNRLVVRKNHVHHNTGPGLWTDIDNVNSLIEENVCEDNTQMGIFHEISFAAIIRNNTVRRNAVNAVNWWLYGGGILVAHSKGVEVYGNVCEDNYNGIVAIDQGRGLSPHGNGMYELRDLHVHDNTIVQRIRYAGGVATDTGDAIFTSRNLRYANNRYTLGTATAQPRPFAWANGDRTIQEWQAAGHDVTGVFTR
jgi:parallel beta-helix repeat protein